MKFLATLGIVVLMLSGFVDAAGSAAMAGVERPPQRYLGFAKMKVVISYVKNIRGICGGPKRTVGCVKRSKGVCHIYIATNTLSATPNDVRAHEWAHCNGWHHHHH